MRSAVRRAEGLGYQHSRIIWASPERTWGGVVRDRQRSREDGKEAEGEEAMAQCGRHSRRKARPGGRKARNERE